MGPDNTTKGATNLLLRDDKNNNTVISSQTVNQHDHIPNLQGQIYLKSSASFYFSAHDIVVLKY